MNNTLNEVSSKNDELFILTAMTFSESSLYANILEFKNKLSQVYSSLTDLKDNITSTINIKYEASYPNTLDNLNQLAISITNYQTDYLEKIINYTEELYDEYMTLYKKHQQDFKNYLENAKYYIQKYNFVSAVIRSYKSDTDDNTRLFELKSNLNHYKTRFDSCIKNMTRINNLISDLLEKGLNKK